MARETNERRVEWRTARLFLILPLVLIFFFGFILARVDSPRVERIRFAVSDTLLPSFDNVFYRPLNTLSGIARNFQSYKNLYEQNRELRKELQQMRAWREAALQLEQTNAELRALNNLKISETRNYVTGEIMADSGSPYSQSALINIGKNAGVTEGAVAVDGLGVVGRVTGVGEKNARVLFLTDRSSQITVLVMPERARGIIRGDNSLSPELVLVDSGITAQPGARVVTSGDGGVFPQDLVVGYVVIDPEGRPKVQLAANFRAMEFLRILLHSETPQIDRTETIILPAPKPEPTDKGAETDSATDGDDATAAPDATN